MLQTLTNPCHECDHHLNGGDKNDPQCEGCQKRIDYAQALGGLSESVPDDVDINGGGIVDFDEQIKKYIKNLCEEAGVTPGFLMIVKNDRIANPIRSAVLAKFKGIHPKILSEHLGISQSAIYQRKRIVDNHQKKPGKKGTAVETLHELEKLSEQLTHQKKKNTIQKPKPKRGGENMKNKLIDLNNHLFAEIERLSNEDLNGKELRQEIMRARAVSNVATHIIGTGRLVLNAKIAINEGLIKDPPLMLSGYEEED